MQSLTNTGLTLSLIGLFLGVTVSPWLMPVAVVGAAFLGCGLIVEEMHRADADRVEANKFRKAERYYRDEARRIREEA